MTHKPTIGTQAEVRTIAVVGDVYRFLATDTVNSFSKNALDPTKKGFYQITCDSFSIHFAERRAEISNAERWMFIFLRSIFLPYGKEPALDSTGTQISSALRASPRQFRVQAQSFTCCSTTTSPSGLYTKQAVKLSTSSNVVKSSSGKFDGRSVKGLEVTFLTALS
jgi:hypothetical protein